ncbi:MAG: cytochrome C [Pirellulaceae bacterium]|nr:cytochrome C [Pirellulaceae bacterium]
MRRLGTSLACWSIFACCIASNAPGQQPPVPTTTTPRALKDALRVALMRSNNDDLLSAADDDLLTDDLHAGAVAGGNAEGDLLDQGFHGDDLLGGDTLSPHSSGIDVDPLSNLGPHASAAPLAPGKDPHEDLWTEDCYPSAESCRQCHPVQYEQWRGSGHAYASISPMFNRFEQSMQEYTKGTVGHFCQRCHSPVGTQLKIPRAASLLEAPPVVREGVTCIACHRVNEHYWRGSNGDRRIEPGNIHMPVRGTSNGQGVASAVARANELKLKLTPDPTLPGQPMHNGSKFFQPLTNSDLCVSCHQVAVHPGIWLEVVHSQYRNGPAAKRGVTCQQCHMGAVPGKADGYEQGHIAEISGKPFGLPRKRSNHGFWGPGYSIAHPGVFPHNPDARRYTPRQWMSFDYRAGWGTDAFEQTVSSTAAFPAPWDTTDDRRDARRIVDANLAKVQEKRASAIMTYNAALEIGKPIFYNRPQAGDGLKIGFKVSNKSDGHNMPTGSLGAQPQLWLNVALINPDGKRVWESGYLDRNGDLADMHSTEVALGRISRDKDLFNLQTKFLINNGLRGTDREAALPINFSVDPLPFLRPGAVPVSVLNHPPLIRMEAHSIAPLDHRIAKYKIPAAAFCKPGPYRISVRMRSRNEPIYFMRQIGSTPDMIRRMNENMLDLRPSSHTFWVK